MAKTVQELVHEQVAAKIAAGEALEAAVDVVRSAQRELTDREGDAAAKRRAAIKAGWTESELRSLGLASRDRARRRPPMPAAASSSNVGVND